MYTFYPPELTVIRSIPYIGSPIKIKENELTVMDGLKLVKPTVRPSTYRNLRTRSVEVKGTCWNWEETVTLCQVKESMKLNTNL